jgi:hypothetical protein
LVSCNLLVAKIKIEIETISFTYSNTTISFVDSRRIDFLIRSKRAKEIIFDPNSVSNGGWDQKLDHLLGLLSQIIGWQNEIEIETISSTYLNTTFTYVDLREIDCHNRSLRGEGYSFDPTSVSNGGWDQKLDHLRGLM